MAKFILHLLLVHINLDHSISSLTCKYPIDSPKNHARKLVLNYLYRITETSVLEQKIPINNPTLKTPPHSITHYTNHLSLNLTHNITHNFPHNITSLVFHYKHQGSIQIFLELVNLRQHLALMTQTPKKQQFTITTTRKFKSKTIHQMLAVKKIELLLKNKTISEWHVVAIWIGFFFVSSWCYLLLETDYCSMYRIKCCLCCNSWRDHSRAETKFDTFEWCDLKKSEPLRKENDNADQCR